MNESTNDGGRWKIATIVRVTVAAVSL